MPVVTAADEAFAPGLLALAKSLVVLGACHRLHVVDCGLSDTTIKRLQEISPEVRLIQDLTIPPLPAPSVGSLSTYARLFIVGRFQGQPRVVYLDADTVALVDPCGLHSIDLGSHGVIGACVEPYTPFVSAPNGISRFRELGLDPLAPYFNAGVMLIHPTRWLKQGITEQAVEYLAHPGQSLNLFDQEALNAVLCSRWTMIDPEWNVSRYWMKAHRRAFRPGVLKNAKIVHFLSQDKPWLPGSNAHPWMLNTYQHFAATD